MRQAVLSKTEVDVLLREATLLNHRFYDVWVVAVLTGMRAGEMYALKWTDGDFEGDKIQTRAREGRGKQITRLAQLYPSPLDAPRTGLVDFPHPALPDTFAVQVYVA